MKPKMLLRIALLIGLLAFPLRAVAVRAEPARPAPAGQSVLPGGPAADLQVTAAGLAWLPRQECGGWQLQVAAPGGSVLQFSFAAAEDPSFARLDASGNPRPDGQYTYELWCLPVEPGATTAPAPGDHGQAVSAVGLYQSGGFVIRAGAIYLPDASAIEPAAPPPEPLPDPDDQVINDDLIVDGYACIGISCAEGESFSYVPLKLKWDYTEIHFEDSSSTLGYPTNDWAIIANDRDQYGSSYFSVKDVTAGVTPFKILAGAPASALVVNANGDIGLGTAAPVGELEVSDDSEPSLFLRQVGGSDPAHLWSLNATHFMFNIWDDTASTTPFKIETSSPTNSLYVDSSGYVGIGTSSPAAKLHVAGDLRVDGFVNERSDRNAKTAFAAVDGDAVLARLAELPVTTWAYTDAPGVRHIGPTAQDFRAAYGFGPDELHLAALDANGVALVSIQALHRQLQAKDARIAALEARLQALEARPAAPAAASPWSQLSPLLLGLLGLAAGMRLARKPVK